MVLLYTLYYNLMLIIIRYNYNNIHNRISLSTGHSTSLVFTAILMYTKVSMSTIFAVSYTHLDVYKRQIKYFIYFYYYKNEHLKFINFISYDIQ